MPHIFPSTRRCPPKVDCKIFTYEGLPDENLFTETNKILTSFWSFITENGSKSSDEGRVASGPKIYAVLESRSANQHTVKLDRTKIFDSRVRSLTPMNLLRDYSLRNIYIPGVCSYNGCAQLKFYHPVVHGVHGGIIAKPEKALVHFTRRKLCSSILPRRYVYYTEPVLIVYSMVYSITYINVPGEYYCIP